MKRPRLSTVAGALTGATLAVVAAHALPGCSALPPYASLGLHWTTIPPTPTAPTSQASAPTPSAAARP